MPLNVVVVILFLPNYLAAYRDVYMSTRLQTPAEMRLKSLCTVIAAWLNASQRSRVGVGKNRYALYKIIPLPFSLTCHISSDLVLKFKNLFSNTSGNIQAQVIFDRLYQVSIHLRRSSVNIIGNTFFIERLTYEIVQQLNDDNDMARRDFFVVDVNALKERISRCLDSIKDKVEAWKFTTELHGGAYHHT